MGNVLEGAVTSVWEPLVLAAVAMLAASTSLPPQWGESACLTTGRGSTGTLAQWSDKHNLTAHLEEEEKEI